MRAIQLLLNPHNQLLCADGLALAEQLVERCLELRWSARLAIAAGHPVDDALHQRCLLLARQHRNSVLDDKVEVGSVAVAAHRVRAYKQARHLGDAKHVAGLLVEQGAQMALHRG